MNTIHFLYVTLGKVDCNRLIIRISHFVSIKHLQASDFLYQIVGYYTYMLLYILLERTIVLYSKVHCTSHSRKS